MEEKKYYKSNLGIFSTYSEHFEDIDANYISYPNFEKAVAEILEREKAIQVQAKVMPNEVLAGGSKCFKCGNEKLLTMKGNGYFTADAEPYESLKEEESEVKELENDELIILYCEKCNQIVDIWLNDEDYCNNKSQREA